jgi:hypothetical protein
MDYGLAHAHIRRECTRLSGTWTRCPYLTLTVAEQTCYSRPQQASAGLSRPQQAY